MDDFKEEQLTEEPEKEILKRAITTIVENYKMLLVSNNKISNEDKKRFYNELQDSVIIMEFITKCNLDKGVLWNGLEI